MTWQVNTEYLRKKKGENLQNWYARPFELSDEAPGVWQGGPAIILPLVRFAEDELLFGRAGVADSEGVFVEAARVPGRVGGAYEVPYIPVQNESVIYGGCLIPQWGHFLVESAARLWYPLNHPEDRRNIIFVGKKGELPTLRGNFRRFFELLGLWDRIVVLSEPAHFREVTVPEAAYRWRSAGGKSFTDIFLTAARAVPEACGETFPEKIFLSRSALKDAAYVDAGGSLLDAFFEKNGYRVLHPEQLSLDELVLFLRHADHIATAAGSVHHNLLFAENGAAIDIMERGALNNEIQVDLNRMKQFSATYVDAAAPIYPVNISSGPFLITWTDEWEAFARARGLAEPDRRFLDEAFRRDALRHYMEYYRRLYGLRWVMEDWEEEYIDLLREAYKDSLRYYGEFLSGEKALFASDAVKPQYLKKALRGLVRK